MIFVVLGTWEMPFQRPLIEIEKSIINGDITEPVIIQSGNTKFKSKVLKMQPFFAETEFIQLFKKASLVIVQAGIGSIMNGLKYNKKVIAIARREKFNEHIDDHQMEILQLFSEKGYILAWKENTSFKEIFQTIDTFSPVPYPFVTEKISEYIINFIENSK